jgi:predicted nucleic acid-binding Zn ribbon protein
MSMSYWDKYVKVTNHCKNCDRVLSLIRPIKLHKFCSNKCRDEFNYKRKKELKHGRETKKVGSIKG